MPKTVTSSQPRAPRSEIVSRCGLRGSPTKPFSISRSDHVYSQRSTTTVSHADIGRLVCRSLVVMGKKGTGPDHVLLLIEASRYPGETKVPAPTREALFQALATTATALERENVSYVVGGGLAAEAYHLRETINDIDLFVRPIDAPKAISVIASVGFYTWIEDPRWLYKGIKNEVTVDIIYESTGLVHVGDETFRRARRIEFDHTIVPIMPPEDLFVMKAAAATQSAPKHWLDAVSLLASQPMDWQYLVNLASHSPRKVLQAILHAYREGVQVPSFVFVQLAGDLIA